jgi:hypothetical protein
VRAPPWTDATSYQRNAERVPTTWEMRLGQFRLVITCAHIFAKGEWVCHFRPLWECKALGIRAENHSANLAEAKRKALTQAALALDEAAREAKAALREGQ